MDVDDLRPIFTYLLLERVDPAKNENRFYYLAWQPSLFDYGTVVRMYGRRDGQQRKLRPLPYPSLAEAWPLIRALIRRRLRHGYQIKEPAEIGQAIAQRQQIRTGTRPTATLTSPSLAQLSFDYQEADQLQPQESTDHEQAIR
jgi:predicted DNA-binding WGR domain protein